MVFYQFLGWSTFWIGLLISIILFIKYKKLYPIVYLLSICLYIFSVGFMIDVFKFGKLGIMISLIFSSILFILLGLYFSNMIEHKK